jgi:hypothetical protein
VFVFVAGALFIVLAAGVGADGAIDLFAFIDQGGVSAVLDGFAAEEHTDGHSQNAEEENGKNNEGWEDEQRHVLFLRHPLGKSMQLRRSAENGMPFPALSGTFLVSSLLSMFPFVCFYFG